MRKIFLLTVMAGFTLSSLAQIDRSKPPKSGPPPVIAYKEPATFKLSNGMTVIVVENHKLPKVTATLSIDYGPVKEGNKAGVMQLMGEMLSEGTTTMPKAVFDESIDILGADVSLSSSGGYVSALTRFFEKAFLLMADGIRSPLFTQESFDKLQKQMITGLKSNEKSASAISSRVVTALGYGKNTAMGEFITEESVKALTLNDIKDAYRNYITPSRSYLTFVGDITPNAAKLLAEKAYGTWKGRKLELPSIPNAENPKATEINFVDVPTAVQGEITIANLVNNPMTSPDYHALTIANYILGGSSDAKLFMNLREKHGFTYGSYSNIGSGRFQTMFRSSAQVRSEKADSAVAEILREIDNMRNGKVTQEELDLAKAKYNGSFALGMEDPSRAATHATNIMINNLPKDFYQTFLQKINALTLADVQRVSKKYFDKDKSRIIIAGNAEKIIPNLARLGYPIKKYDKYANPVVEDQASVDETAKTSDAVSAFSVIQSYIKAVGGKEEIEKIKTIKSTYSVEMMGMTLQAMGMKMAPDKEYMEISMGANKVYQQSFDGTSGYNVQGGQKKALSEDELKDVKDKKGIIPQIYYIGSGYTTSYIGTGKAGGENAYKIKVTKPSGKVAIEYYSMKSGLLLREESTVEQQGTEMPITTEYSNYIKVGNILIPGNTTQTVGPQEFTLVHVESKINEGVTEADFK